MGTNSSFAVHLDLTSSTASTRRTRYARVRYKSSARESLRYPRSSRFTSLLWIRSTKLEFAHASPADCLVRSTSLANLVAATLQKSCIACTSHSVIPAAKPLEECGHMELHNRVLDSVDSADIGLPLHAPSVADRRPLCGTERSTACSTSQLIHSPSSFSPDTRAKYLH